MSTPAGPAAPRDTGAEPLEDLVARAHAWADADPDEQTAGALRALLTRVDEQDAGALAELRDRFAGTLAFGTAGLRGAMGPGPNRMNRAVVIRAAAGLAAFLRGRSPADQSPSVVIGYDARHRSADFARDTAAVMAGAGVRARLLPRPLPTPVLAFAVRHLGADAGVMVTASHNPAADNGYKVYLGGEDGGSQIVPPSDASIAGRIAAVGAIADVPRPREGWEVLGDDVVDAYAAGAAALVPPVVDQRRAGLRVALTLMHGVGGEVATRVLAAAGLTDVALVPQQAEPEPDFPTVAFPNPEEPGALDLALSFGSERGADLVLALDPDADRCAVAVPHPPDPARRVGPAREPGHEPGRAGSGWKVLSGDELGVVLGETVAATGVPGALVRSVVSSRMLDRVAAAHGRESVSTLTGFKWISRVPGMAFGYEEAIGFCVAPALVRDKDGITAALLTAALAADLAAQGRSVLDVLDDLARTHGVHATGQLAVRVEDLSVITGAMRTLRADPPLALAGSAVVETTDLLAGGGSLPPTDGLVFRTADDARVVVRPSGTEPKLKAYLEAVVPVTGDLTAARARAGDRLDALRRDVAAAIGL